MQKARSHVGACMTQNNHLLCLCCSLGEAAEEGELQLGSKLLGNAPLTTRERIRRDRELHRLGLHLVEKIPKDVLVDLVQVCTLSRFLSSATPMHASLTDSDTAPYSVLVLLRDCNLGRTLYSGLDSVQLLLLLVQPEGSSRCNASHYTVLVLNCKKLCQLTAAKKANWKTWQDCLQPLQVAEELMLLTGHPFQPIFALHVHRDVCMSVNAGVALHACTCICCMQ